jgi:pyridoxal phosphate enzyme (YggS family)
MTSPADVAANLDAVRQRVRAAAERAGRDPASVTLLAVAKTFDADLVRAAAAAGQRHFGENRVQEGADKAARVADLPLEWHLIGHVQSNKARKAAAVFDWIHSVDRPELVSKLDDAASAAGRRVRILLQVDLAHEATKSGADREAIDTLARAAVGARALDLVGLMTIPPIPDDPEASRPWFRQLRELRDALVAAGIPAGSMRELSMGMSQDFDVAIAEGATIVRVGTAIFGARARQDARRA